MRAQITAFFFVLTLTVVARAMDDEAPTEMRALTEAPTVVAGRFVDEPTLRTATFKVMDDHGRSIRLDRFVQEYSFRVEEIIDGPDVPSRIPIVVIGNPVKDGAPRFDTGDLTTPEVRVVIGVQPYPRLGKDAHVVVLQRHMPVRTDAELRKVASYLQTVRRAAAPARAEPEDPAEAPVEGPPTPTTPDIDAVDSKREGPAPLGAAPGAAAAGPRTATVVDEPTTVSDEGTSLLVPKIEPLGPRDGLRRASASRSLDAPRGPERADVGGKDPVAPGKPGLGVGFAILCALGSLVGLVVARRRAAQST